MELHVLPFGAIVQTLKVPDSTGVLRDVALGFDTLEPYQVSVSSLVQVCMVVRVEHCLCTHAGACVQNGTSPYFGSVVGRVANRVANSTFELDGETYHVTPNENSTSLHGGKYGFSRHFLDGYFFTNGTSQGLKLQRISPDGDEVRTLPAAAIRVLVTLFNSDTYMAQCLGRLHTSRTLTAGPGNCMS